MKDYQKKYLENTEIIMRIMEQKEDTDSYRRKTYDERRECCGRVRELMNDNMEMLRKEIIPFIDDIYSADRKEIDDLIEFDGELVRLTRGQDNGLHYLVNKALVSYARNAGERELLIRELYQTAMALFEFKNLLEPAADGEVSWKMRMLFGEAAGYIREYDEINDAQVRGYIHRSMGNLALTYGKGEGHKKMAAVNRSLKYLTSSVYHEKTPSLPWESFIYKTHQERTTLLAEIRSDNATIEEIKAVMESAEYVHNEQLKAAKEKKTGLQPQWLYAYYAASYHCGLSTLSEFLEKLEEIYISASMQDYSQQGQYANVFIPALYSDYVNKNPKYISKKKTVVTMMYGRLMRYVKEAPYSADKSRLFWYLRGYLMTFIEYPGGMTFKNYIYEMIEGKHPDTSIHSFMVGTIAEFILRCALKSRPELLLGVRGYNTPEELREHKEELCRFMIDAGKLHDIGKLYFLSMFRLPNRRWTALEETIYQHHCEMGSRMLERCPSTRDYAPIALGHHRWHDQKGGYPDSYDRKKQPDAALTDIIQIADYIDKKTDEAGDVFTQVLSYDELARRLECGAGTRFSPGFVDVVLENGRKLKELLERERKKIVLPGKI